MLTLSGASPAAAAASMPSSTRATGKSTSFIARNVASSSESRLTVTRLSPASARLRAFFASSAPLVVSVRSSVAESSPASRPAARCSGAAAARRRSGGSCATPRLDEDARDARDLLERQQLGVRQERVVAAEDVLRHAVDAAEVAAVGDRDPQVVQRPAARVGDRPGASQRRSPRRARRVGAAARRAFGAAAARTSMSGMIVAMREMSLRQAGRRSRTAMLAEAQTAVYDRRRSLAAHFHSARIRNVHVDVAVSRRRHRAAHAARESLGQRALGAGRRRARRRGRAAVAPVPVADDARRHALALRRLRDRAAPHRSRGLLPQHHRAGARRSS